MWLGYSDALTFYGTELCVVIGLGLIWIGVSIWARRRRRASGQRGRGLRDRNL